MLKRVIALLLCLVLVAAAVPVRAAAADDAEVTRITKQLSRSYRLALSNTGRSSLNGYCGLMTGYLLWLLDVTDWPEVYDGRDYIDAYNKQEYTSCGNKVTVYSAAEYTLLEALQAASRCGTQDVYNIVVGFQRTNTAAGARYGHAMVIQAILDGQVYFVEGFRTSIGGWAGSPCICSMEEFAEFYGSWCTFEGIAVCGKRDYTDFCTAACSDQFVKVQCPTQLWSLPDMGEDSQVLRSVAEGELLHVTDIYQNTAGALYYRVMEGETAGYIPVDTVKPELVDTEDLAAAVTLPQRQEEDTALALSGTLEAANSRIETVRAVVTDEYGSQVVCAQAEVGGQSYALSGLNQALSDVKLSLGSYTLSLYADVTNHLVVDGAVVPDTQTALLAQSVLQVGDVVHGVFATEATETVQAGWVYDGGAWYYYQDGAPRTGWFCCEGVDYYFDETGAATTGWVTVNGRLRCFTDTGAMRTGWAEYDGGMCYLLSNGVMAQGWRVVDGTLYCFGEDGLLMTDCTAEYQGVMYVLGEDGAATPAA